MPPDPVELGFLIGPMPPGTRSRLRFPVTESMLTHHIPGRGGVLTTPNLVAILEEAAADIVRPLLADGAAAVGTWVGVHHTGAAGLAETVEVTATVRSVDGRLLGFDVSAVVGTRRIGHGDIGFTLVRAAR
jgi:predicted thioesterase